VSGRGAERETAIAAVARAALLCRSVRDAFDDRLRQEKADRSPVTVADLGAQVIVSRALAATFPADPLVGEEDSASLADPAIADAVALAIAAVEPALSAGAIAAALDRGGAAGGAAGRWWTLDPVDGTKGFLRNEQYAIALALVEDGVPVLGILGCPNLPRSDGSGIGALFLAERGAGAEERSLDDPATPGRRIRVSGVTSTAAARYAESVEAAHSAQDEAAAIAARLGIAREPIRMDSQAKYGVVARGEAEIYLRIPRGDYRENIWDHAAGVVVVEEAGGVVSDVDGRPLDFTTGRRLLGNRGIVAAPAALHAKVVDAVRSVLAGGGPAAGH